MDNILIKKQNGISLVDAGTIAVSKPIIEAGFNLVGIGNNNLISAIAKGLGAGVTASVLGKSNMARNVSTAMLVSAVDDVISRFIPGISPKKASNTNVVGGGDSNQGVTGGAFI